MEGYRWRTFLALLGVTVALIMVVPNLINLQNKWWFTHEKLNYGLDIQGGLHLVMGVDVQGVVSESIHRMSSTLKTEMQKENIQGLEINITKAESGELTINFTGPENKSKIESYLTSKYATILQQVSATDNSLTYRYFEAYLSDYKTKVIHQAIETIRNRVDEFGVAEPSISQQGDDRILVQLPGMADAEKAKQLINATAKLDFMLVSTEKTQQELVAMIAEAEKVGGYSMDKLKYSEYVQRLNSDLKSKLPEKTTVYFQKSDNAVKLEAGALPFLLKIDTELGGDVLTDAFVSFGQYGEPEVALQLNSAGAVKFADITGNNVGKQLAIVLDKVVKTAPNINGRIPSGEARITLGNRSDRVLEEAKMIATTLRAGALPATLEQLEERRVGPTLGADAINKAKLASYVGSIIIIIFMLLYYKGMGLISNISLGINILSLLALLSSFGATLTLPGIAGIALTVGFAVDANVLINERIREELRIGTSWKLALKEGYSKAMSAILDSNITTASTAVILLYFGTGPVKGFAVTLLIGIATTLFANVFVSKLIVDTLVHKMGVQKISV